MYYSKVSNRVFYDECKSLLKKVNDDKVLLVLDYLYTETNRKGCIKFVLEDMICECGFIPNRNKGKINDVFRNILSLLQYENIIKCDDDLSKIKPKQVYKCELLIDLDNQYIKLYEFEKDKILNQSVINIDNLKLLTLYCYLKSRMYARNNDNILERDGGKAETCYPTYSAIADDINITEGIIKKYIDILVQLDLIRYDNAGLYYFKNDKNKITRESANTYTLYKDGWENELKLCIKQHKSLANDRIFVKEYKNNDKKLNGEKGYLQRLINQGKATDKHMHRLNEINDIIAARNGESDIKFSVTSLLEQNEGELLSNIYYDETKHNLADKYYDIELRLGLVDDNYNLLVDWDYYKWVIINYNENEHDKYVNYVGKYKRDKENEMDDVFA